MNIHPLRAYSILLLCYFRLYLFQSTIVNGRCASIHQKPFHFAFHPSFSYASLSLHQSFCFHWLLVLLSPLQSFYYHFRLDRKPPPIILSHRASFLVKIGLNTLFVLCNLIPLPPRMLLCGLFFLLFFSCEITSITKKGGAAAAQKTFSHNTCIVISFIQFSPPF